MLCPASLIFAGAAGEKVTWKVECVSPGAFAASDAERSLVCGAKLAPLKSERGEIAFYGCHPNRGRWDDDVEMEVDQPPRNKYGTSHRKSRREKIMDHAMEQLWTTFFRSEGVYEYVFE